MLLVKTKIGVSDIHGIGLFADESISKGKVIWKHNPSIDIKLTEDQIAQLSDACRKQILAYSYKQRSTGLYILCGDDARFMNHSSTPNCIDVKDENGSGITVTLRDIELGEELTCDYYTIDQNLIEGKPFS